MRVPAWFTEMTSRRKWRQEGVEPAPPGDFRGNYGFGHRAHRPDPAAKYKFEAPVLRNGGNPGK